MAVFTNSAGSATTSAATLTVNTSVAPVISSNPSNDMVTAGQSATFTASAGGNPTPTVQWQVSSDGGKTFTNISGATSTSLTLDSTTPDMSGIEYQAVFTNKVGSATTAAALLTVEAGPVAPTITGNPTNQSVTAGGSNSFTASATGTPAPSVQWQVSTDGGKLFTSIPGATNVTLTLNNATTAMSGYKYEAVFTNSAGSATSSAATLTVNPVASPLAPPKPPAPLVLNAPPLLAFFDNLLGGIEMVNANGTETITDSLFGIPFLDSTYNSHGELMSVALFGFFNITFMFV